MKRNLFAATALILILATLFSMAGCASGIQAKNLMEGITPRDVDTIENLFELSVPITDFAIRLFAASQGEGENTLLSPLSVLYALAMTVNGATDPVGAGYGKTNAESVPPPLYGAAVRGRYECIMPCKLRLVYR